MKRNARGSRASKQPLWGMLLVAALVLTACGEVERRSSVPSGGLPSANSSTSVNPAATTGAEAPPSAEMLIEHFRNRGLPIGEVVLWPVESSPEAVGTIPRRYTSKATFYDLRLERGPDPGIGAGGDIEIFAAEADLRARREYLTSLNPAPGPLGHYIFSRGLVLLRVSKTFTSQQATAYDAALAAALTR